MKSNKSLWYAAKTFLVEAQNRITRKVVLLGVHKTSKPSLIRLGSYYGGWWIPIESLSPKFDNKVCISAGIGGDVTFDKELLDAGFQVLALDPLEQCVSFANTFLEGYANFSTLRAGLWIHTGTQRFFAPKESEHDAWSATNTQSTPLEDSRSFPVITLYDLLREYPEIVESEYSILKMDIEGAEFEVISDLCSIEYRFNWLAIEMDCLSLIPFRSIKSRITVIRKVKKLLRELARKEYVFRSNEKYNFFWSLTNLDKEDSKVN